MDNKKIQTHSSETSKIKEKYFGKIGLPNLGNTCYANSVIQVLSHIFQLSIFLMKGEYKKFINKNNNMGSGGKIVTKLANLIQILWTNKDVVITEFKINDQLKKAYYYDQEKAYEIKQAMIYLLDSISKNNILYTGYEQHDCIEFMIYLIDIIHEDLNQADKKKISSIQLNKGNIEDVLKYKLELFKGYNDSFIFKIFYGIFQIETTCCECFNSEYNFEYFNFVDLPIFQTLNKPLNQELEEFKKKKKKKINYDKNFQIPGRNQLYFINCILIPYHMNKKSFKIIIPILHKIYINSKIGFICKIIRNLFDENSIIPTLLTSNHEKFKSILDENSYFYQFFKNPHNISIYFIQLENHTLNIELMNNILKPQNFVQLINSNYELLLKDKKEQNENIFNLDEINTIKLDENESNSIKINKEKYENEKQSKSNESSSTISINNDSLSVSIDCLYMIINVYFSNMKYETLKFPRLFKFSSIESLKKLYEIIYAYYNIGNHKIKKNQNFNIQNYSLKIWGKDISKFQFSIYNYEFFLKNDKNLESSSPYPFTLCLYLKSINSNDGIKKKLFIPIPFTDDILINYINKIKNNNLNDKYEFKDSIIYVIWFESNLKELKELEDKVNLNQFTIIDPFSQIEELEKQSNQDIEVSKKLINNNKMENLTELLENFVDYEKYDENITYFCEKCQKNVLAFKKIDFYDTPKVLILYLKKKINAELYKVPIKFPINEQLDLSKYYKGEKTENCYELISIINFVGNNYTGHYNVYCKHPLENKWYLFNDSACFIIDDISKDIKYEDVYTVIYQKIDYKIKI